MSYFSAGLMDDMMGFVEETSISPGKDLGGRWKKFQTCKDPNIGIQYKGGNTKVSENILLRCYIKAGADTFDTIEKLNGLSIQMSQGGIIQRFRKWLKRFYIWVAHAWFRENPTKISRSALRMNGAFNERSRFFKNELLIKEWIKHVHYENGDETKCPNCLGTGLMPKDGYGKWQWDYCDCHYGTIRRNCLKTKTGWRKGQRSFT